MHGLHTKTLTGRGQLVALAQAEVEQLVGGVGLGVAVLLVTFGNAESLGNTQGQDTVALVRGCGVLVVTAQAQRCHATAGSGERRAGVLGGHSVVVKQAQAEQATGGAAKLEGVAVVAFSVVVP
jgi:hypothetical protein